MSDEVFQQALAICSKAYPEEAIKVWLQSLTNISDVHKVVEDAQLIYGQKPRSKARKWLTRLSSRISVYGSALDMLAQHHPEYLALAWGSFKFLIVVRVHITSERTLARTDRFRVS
jgi:preprotein translocase subunit SecY